MKSPPVSIAHNELKMKKQTNAKQPRDCTNISHYFFMGENWELTLLCHFIPMEYFHKIVGMLQTLQEE